MCYGGIELPDISVKRNAPHRYVPDGFDPLDGEALARLYDGLEARDVSSKEALVGFIDDWEELGGAIIECSSVAYIDMTVDTTNPEYEERYIRTVEEMLPVQEQRDFALKQKVLASPAVDT